MGGNESFDQKLKFLEKMSICFRARNKFVPYYDRLIQCFLKQLATLQEFFYL